MKPFSTVVDLVRYVEKKYSNSQALNYQFRGGWEHVSTKAFMEQVRHLALGLRSLGVNKGEMVGILSNSSPQWTIADLSIMLAGGVTIPLFANISDENFDFEVTQTEIKYIFVAGKEQWEMFERHKDRFNTVIALRYEEEFIGALSFDEVIAKGSELDERQPNLYEEMRSAIKPEDLGSIVYTSGSTGVPKGVMLNHSNLVGLLHLDPFGWKSNDDAFLSILPLAHIFARSVNYITLAWGVRIFYLSDITQVSAACKEIRPTFAILVPRVLEKIYAKMLYRVHHSSPIKKAIGIWAFDLAKSKGEGVFYKIKYAIADKLVYSKLREALGDNFHFIISGGASLNPQLNLFFRNIGLPLFEGWGLTEAATVGSNLREKNKIGTVGIPFDGMEVKISKEGEILVQGPIVMQGYYKNEEATKEAFTEDRWLRTGDKGFVDEEGYVTIQGRLKELYKTSTGEYIAPVPIEQELCKSPLIDMALVVGDGKKFASCLLFPDFEFIKALKKSYKMENMNDEEFLNSKRVKGEVKRLIEKVNLNLNHWEEIHGFRFVPATPTIEGGELTPTMKIRRDVVMEKYRHLIDSIYQEEVT